MPHQFSIILATDESWGVARAGNIPWYLPADLKRFKEITMGDIPKEVPNACIMGRITYESIPEKFRPLPNRLNIVLTRDPSKLSGATPKTSLESALEHAQENARDVFVIGGASVYKQCFLGERPANVYLTRVPGDFSCDQHVSWLKKILREEYALATQEDLQGGAILETYHTNT